MLKRILRTGIRTVIRQIPLVSGMRRIAFNRPMNWLLNNLPENMEVRLRDGTPIFVTTADDDGRIIYLFGVADIKVAATAAALIAPTDVFLDIGANYGTIGFEVAQNISPGGAVHIFEPQALLAERIGGAIRAGDRDNIHLHPIGLLDVDGTFELRRPENHSGMGSFVHGANHALFTKNEICQVRAISDYLPPLIEGHPFGVKLDVEGAEPNILPFLAGQPNLRFIIVEANGNHETIFELLNLAGLSIFGILRHPFRIMFKRVDHFEQLSQFSDLLALRISHAPPKASLADLRKLMRDA